VFPKRSNDEALSKRTRSTGATSHENEVIGKSMGGNTTRVHITIDAKISKSIQNWKKVFIANSGLTINTDIAIAEIKTQLMS
jgi:triacylglycerol esterase/lipase EstA (alpha/beta hydrolase family)